MTALATLSLQLYSLHRETADDAEGTLRQVGAMGYDGVELAGDYGWEAEKWRRGLAEAGVAAVGAHVGLEKLEEDFNAQAEFCHAIGCSRIIVPALPGELRASADGYRSAAARLNALAQRAREAGFALLYHNHAFEFEPLAGDVCGMDVLLEATDPALVRFEFDTYWLERGGRDSRRFIEEHAARTGMIHAKELRQSDGADVPAGQGNVDFPAIVTLARQNDWPVVVEYEGENALESVRESAKYLRGLG